MEASYLESFFAYFSPGFDTSHSAGATVAPLKFNSPQRRYSFPANLVISRERLNALHARFHRMFVREIGTQRLWSKKAKNLTVSLPVCLPGGGPRLDLVGPGWTGLDSTGPERSNQSGKSNLPRQTSR